MGTISLALYAKQIGTTNKRFPGYVANGLNAWQVLEDLLKGSDKSICTVPDVYVNDDYLYSGEETYVDMSGTEVEEFL